MRQDKLTSRRPSNDTDSLALLDAEAGAGRPPPDAPVKVRALPTGFSGLVLRTIVYLSKDGRVTLESVKQEFVARVAVKEDGKDTRRDTAGALAAKLVGSGWTEGDAAQGYSLNPSSSHGAHVFPAEWFSDSPTFTTQDVDARAQVMAVMQQNYKDFSAYFIPAARLSEIANAHGVTTKELAEKICMLTKIKRPSDGVLFYKPREMNE